MPINYSKIRLMRELLTEEVKSQFPTLTVEHYLLVEERVQTALMAELDDSNLRATRNEWKDKRP